MGCMAESIRIPNFSAAHLITELRYGSHVPCVLASMVRNATGLLTSTRRLESAATNSGDISEYKGPSIKQYPFRAIRMFGAAQLIVALLIQVVTIIQISIGYGDRYIFLATASVNLWTPLPAIAAGIIGITTSKKRYWEAQCMKVAYFVLSILSAAVFMMILLFVTGIVESHYFGLSDAPIDKDVFPLPSPVALNIQDDGDNDMDGTHRALIGTIIALALLELIISFVAVFVICCCAPTYKLKDKALQQKLIGAHDPEVKREVNRRSDDYIPGVIYDNSGVPQTTAYSTHLNRNCTVQPCPPASEEPPVYSTVVRNSIYYGNTNPASSIFIVD